MEPRSYISIVLLPSQEDSDKLVSLSSALSRIAQNNIQLGPQTLPHFTVTRFAAPASALEQLRDEARHYTDVPTELFSGGLRFSPDLEDDKMWADVQFLKPNVLAAFQNRIAESAFAKTYPIHNKQGDAYAPHCTVGQIVGKTIPPLDIAPFDLFRRPFTGLRLAVGINGPHLTLVSAQLVEHEDN